MTAATPPHRRRLDLAAPIPASLPVELELPGPTRLERFAVGVGVWVLPLVNTVLLVILLAR